MVSHYTTILVRKLNLISIKQSGKTAVNIKYTNNTAQRSPAQTYSGRERRKRPGQAWSWLPVRTSVIAVKNILPIKHFFPSDKMK